MLHEVFPQALSVETLDIEKDTLNKLLLMATDTDNHIKNAGKNFFHNETYIFDTVLKDTKLVKDVYEYINRYTVQILGEEPNAIRVTQSWMNVNPPGTSHHKHKHPNSIISGVIYIQADDKSGPFMVHRKNAREDHMIIGKNILNPNKFNFEYVWFEPKPYELYLFNSDLEHSVGVNESTKDRISISFNTFYTGSIGDRMNMTELCL